MADCSLKDDFFAVAPDADIVGIGALVGFISTFAIAFITVCVAYYTDSLPDGLGQSLLWLDIRYARGQHDLSSRQTDPARFERIKAFQKFLIALHDTALVMGAFILVSGLARLDEITTYSVNIVIDLGYFAACANLTIMPALSTELIGHRLLKSVRTFLMALTLGFLLFFMSTQLFWYGADSQYVYYKCALQRTDTINWGQYNKITFLTCLQVMLMLSLFYADGLLMLWSKRYSSCLEPIMARWMSRYGVDSKAVLLYIAKKETDDFSAPSRVNRNSEKWGFYHAYISFECTIAALAFIIVFGITQVFVDREMIKGNDLNKMGFGQILPICALVLPIMAAIKASDEYRDALQALQDLRVLQKQHDSRGTVMEVKESISEQDSESTGVCMKQGLACKEAPHQLNGLANNGQVDDRLIYSAHYPFAIKDSSMNLQRPIPLWMQSGKQQTLPMHTQSTSLQMPTTCVCGSLHQSSNVVGANPLPLQRTTSTLSTINALNIRSSHSLSKRSVQRCAWIWVGVFSIIDIMSGIFLALGGTGYLVLTILFGLIMLRGLFVPLWYFVAIRRIGKTQQSNSTDAQTQPAVAGDGSTSNTV